MPTFIEFKCFKKSKDLLDDKLSAGCAENNEAFNTLKLNKHYYSRSRIYEALSL